MTPLHKAILTELRNLDDAVRQMRQDPGKADLLPFFSRLEELAGQLPRGGDPQLGHYLQRKSYEKARLWLEELEQDQQPGA